MNLRTIFIVVAAILAIAALVGFFAGEAVAVAVLLLCVALVIGDK